MEIEQRQGADRGFRVVVEMANVCNDIVTGAGDAAVVFKEYRRRNEK
jgi:hypothetical protein